MSSNIPPRTVSQRVHLTMAASTWNQLEARVPPAKGGPGRRSEIVSRDLSRLYELYALALAEFPLTRAEAVILAEALREHQHVEAGAVLQTVPRLVLELGRKRGNKTAMRLAEHLLRADRLTLLALADAVSRLWLAASRGEGEPGDLGDLAQWYFTIEE